MPQLPQLRNVETYAPCEWDLKADADGRRYWVDLFCDHIGTLMAAISQEYPETSSDQLDSFRSHYLATMRTVYAHPDRFERIDVLALDELRTSLQAEYGFHDPYRGIKAHENELARALLPELLRELDAGPDDGVVEKLVLGLLAGNLFDLGAAAAVERYHAECADFRQLRASQPPRPWLVDDLDAWRGRWEAQRAYEHVGFFVDNAGSDICLGCLPLVHWMLRKGSRVTLAANSGPALNDVTAPELAKLIADIAKIDALISEGLTTGRLAVVGSGGWAPLIDLTQLASGCVDAIADADLIILHGMGRAIESNFRAPFSCDSLRVAVLKDAAVAQWLGGRLFDCVFRFERAPAS